MNQVTGALRPSCGSGWEVRLADYRPQAIRVDRWPVVLAFVAGCMERLDADDGPGARRVVRVLA